MSIESLSESSLEVLDVLGSDKSPSQKLVEVDRIGEKYDVLDNVVDKTLQDWVYTEYGAEKGVPQALKVTSTCVILKSESVYTPQNWEEIVFEVAASTLPDSTPFTPWMFGCLVTEPLKQNNNWPIMKIVNDQQRSSRLEQVKGRVSNLIEALEKTNITQQWICPIGDYDIKLLYSRILPPDLDSQKLAQDTARAYVNRLNSMFRKKMGNVISVVSWSDYQSQFQTEYDVAREYAMPLINQQIPQSVLDASMQRRIAFFEGLGLSKSPKIESLAQEQLINQITGYAAEGVLLEKYVRPFSLLVVADKDPLRLASYQSLITGDTLPIWFPFGDKE